MNDTVSVPQWSRGDRMYKALEHAHMTVEEMAEYLGVTRATLANWKSGRTPVSLSVLRDWAARTNVPYVWLTNSPEDMRLDDACALISNLLFNRKELYENNPEMTRGIGASLIDEAFSSSASVQITEQD